MKYEKRRQLIQLEDQIHNICTEDEQLELGVKMILDAIGEDSNREGLLDTPKRVAKMFKEITGGMHIDPDEFLKVGFDEDKHKELVLIDNIPFYSTCEHHLATIIGRAHVAYIPNGRVVGLSKVARVVDAYARRLQIQERMTSDIAECIMRVVKPEGCAVMVEGEHMCMSMRGIKKPGTSTTTIAVRGTFLSDPGLEHKFLSLVRGR